MDLVNKLYGNVKNAYNDTLRLGNAVGNYLYELVDEAGNKVARPWLEQHADLLARAGMGPLISVDDGGALVGRFPDLAQLATSGMAGPVPGNAMGAGPRIKLPRTPMIKLSNKEFGQWANENTPDRFRVLNTTGLPAKHRLPLVIDLWDLNERYPLQGKVDLSFINDYGGGAWRLKPYESDLAPGKVTHSLNFTPEAFSDKVLKRDFERGWHPSSDWRSNVVHEYGHALDYELGGFPEASHWYPKFPNAPSDNNLVNLKAWGKDFAESTGIPSGYAATHPAEWFAEMLSGKHYGESFLEESLVMKRFNDYLRERGLE